MLESLSMYAIMLVQLVLIIFGVCALYRMVRGHVRRLDPITVATGLVAATQLNVTLVRMRYGATITNYSPAPDWTVSNFLAMACLLFLAIALVKTSRRLA